MNDDAFTQTRRILESLRDEGAPPKVLVALANLTRIEASWHALARALAAARRKCTEDK